MCFVSPRNSGGFDPLRVCYCSMGIAVYSAQRGLGVNKVTTSAKCFHFSCISSKERIMMIRQEPRVASLSRHEPLVRVARILKPGWFWCINVVVGCLISYSFHSKDMTIFLLFIFLFYISTSDGFARKQNYGCWSYPAYFLPFSKPLCLLFAMYFSDASHLVLLYCMIQDNI